MSFIYNFQDNRWSAVGTTYQGIWLNVDNGAGGSAVGSANSRLLLLTNNNTSRFGVSLEGYVYAGGATPLGANTFKGNNVGTYGTFALVAVNAAEGVLLSFSRSDNTRLGYIFHGETSLTIANNVVNQDIAVTPNGGAFVCNADLHFDANRDIGDNGANQPRDIYVSRDIYTNNAAALLKTTVALTDGAGAGAGTITNAPTAGNPTKWVGINDNGTVRYIPTWT